MSEEKRTLPSIWLLHFISLSDICPYHWLWGKKKIVQPNNGAAIPRLCWVIFSQDTFMVEFASPVLLHHHSSPHSPFQGHRIFMFIHLLPMHKQALHHHTGLVPKTKDTETLTHHDTAITDCSTSMLSSRYSWAQQTATCCETYTLF